MAIIPIFDGTNYKFWSVKMRTLFLSKDLLDTVQDGYNHEANRENQQKDAAALSRIQQGVSDRIFPEIQNATTAREAWDILFQLFSTEEPTAPYDRINARTPAELKQVGATHLIVATLIATVTFAAAFSMPGGYNGNDGPNQGMAVLRRAYIFKFFIVADTTAMSLSISAVLIHFFAAITNNRDELEKLVYIAADLIICAAVAMVIAFVAGTRAVLAHTSGLTILVCVIGGVPPIFLSVAIFAQRDMLLPIFRSN